MEGFSRAGGALNATGTLWSGSSLGRAGGTLNATYILRRDKIGRRGILKWRSGARASAVHSISRALASAPRTYFFLGVKYDVLAPPPCTCFFCWGKHPDSGWSPVGTARAGPSGLLSDRRDCSCRTFAKGSRSPVGTALAGPSGLVKNRRDCSCRTLGKRFRCPVGTARA